MPTVAYNKLKAGLLNGSINLTTDTLKVVLVTATYTPDIDTHEFYSAITNEIVGDGYTAGGAVLANKTITTDLDNDRAIFDADDVTWDASVITNARAAVIYKDTGTPATSPLLCYCDFGENKSSSGGDFTIAWAATGILRLA